MQYDYPDGTHSIIGTIAPDRLIDRMEAIRELFQWNSFRWELCGKVYRANLIKSFYADESITTVEDLDYNWNLFNHAGSVFFSCKSRYHYYSHEDSVTHGLDYKYENELKVYDKIFNSGLPVPLIAEVKMNQAIIRLLTKKIRDLFFEDPRGNLDEISKLEYRLQKLASDYPDEPVLKTGIIDFLEMEMNEQIELFSDEFDKIKKAITLAENYSTIYVYGIGVAAEYVLRSFNNRNTDEIIFVVSDDRYTQNRFCNHDVLKLSEIKPPSNDIAFIMTIQDKYRSEAVFVLKERGYKNIIEFDMRNIYTRI